MTRTPRQLAAENARRVAAGEPALTGQSIILCGNCHHPMHWHECGANADMTAPCRCRNDGERAAPPASPDPLRVALERLHDATYGVMVTGSNEAMTEYKTAWEQARAALAATPVANGQEWLDDLTMALHEAVVDYRADRVCSGTHASGQGECQVMARQMVRSLAAAPVGLDVERLAQALKDGDVLDELERCGSGYEYSFTVSDRLVRLIAAEYARLASEKEKE